MKTIYLLACGLTAAEVARAMKLRRETLSRWKKIPEFTAEFERVMEEVRLGLRWRLTHLIDASITAVNNEIGSYQSDPKRIQTALNVLKLLGIERELRTDVTKRDDNVTKR